MLKYHRVGLCNRACHLGFSGINPKRELIREIVENPHMKIKKPLVEMGSPVISCGIMELESALQERSSDPMFHDTGEVLDLIQMFITSSYTFEVSPLGQLRRLMPNYIWKLHELAIASNGPEKDELEMLVEKSDFLWPAYLHNYRRRAVDAEPFEERSESETSPNYDRHWVSARHRFKKHHPCTLGCSQTDFLSLETRTVLGELGIKFPPFTITVT
jgi:hypothetical protein